MKNKSDTEVWKDVDGLKEKWEKSNLGFVRRKIQSDKYYYPHITEFHVGFEYEQYFEDKWQKRIYNDDLYPNPLKGCFGIINKDAITVSIDELIKLYLIKVKYLDVEDIESFGFERCIPTEEGWFHVFENKISLQLQYLSKNNNKNIIQITQVMFDEPSFIVFWGTIKNKSELKRILEQIGVLEYD